MGRQRVPGREREMLVASDGHGGIDALEGNLCPGRRHERGEPRVPARLRTGMSGVVMLALNLKDLARTGRVPFRWPGRCIPMAYRVWPQLSRCDPRR